MSISLQKSKSKISNSVRGFTLIELLVVISIISLLSSIVLATINTTRASARDAVRLSDMQQIQNALELHRQITGEYPTYSTDNDCSGWDAGYILGENDEFISSLETADVISKTPGDPISSTDCSGYQYRYYRYGAGGNGCDPSLGRYFVLGVKDMETSGRPHPDSPGWSCPGRDWQNEFDWVVGGFE